MRSEMKFTALGHAADVMCAAILLWLMLLPPADARPLIPKQTSPDTLQGADNCAVPPDPRSLSKRPTPRNHVRISAQRAEQMIIRRVAPVYPPLARAARVQGKVELQVKVDKCGAVSEVRPLTGHPMLTHSAIEAVRQWRFRPYLENGKPAGIETILMVNFSLPEPVR